MTPNADFERLCRLSHHFASLQHELEDLRKRVTIQGLELDAMRLQRDEWRERCLSVCDESVEAGPRRSTAQMIRASVIIEDMCAEANLSLIALRAKSRIRDLVALRARICVALLEQLGLTHEAIGVLINRDRATVIHLIERYRAGYFRPARGVPYFAGGAIELPNP